MVSVNLDKPNITFMVKEFVTIESTFGPVAQTLATQQTAVGKSIVFRQRIEDAASY